MRKRHDETYLDQGKFKRTVVYYFKHCIDQAMPMNMEKACKCVGFCSRSRNV